MQVTGIGSVPNLASIGPTSANAPADSSSGVSFGETLRKALENVNDVQADADQLSQKLATGDVQDVHQVMVALEKASTAFGLTMQVRNKVVDAYQEIMRMQI